MGTHWMFLIVLAAVDVIASVFRNRSGRPRGTAATLLLYAISACASPSERSSLPVAEIIVAGVSAEVEIAATDESRSRGLMWRRELCARCGMLFVFPAEGRLRFWMRNTFLPLSIAFIDASGHILNIEEMTQFDEQTQHEPAGAALFALEMSAGWFQHHGVRVGDPVEVRLPRDLIVD